MEDTMSTLTPHLWVEDMKRSIAFYKDVLGFEVRRAEPADSPTFASLVRGESSLMLSPHNEAPEEWGMVLEAGKRRGDGGPVSFYIEAADIEAEYEKAKQAGAVIVDPLAAKPWGQREFTLADPDGFWWALWKV
jgi:uncharacterized glyoxalase superfamily protein PhnB